MALAIIAEEGAGGRIVGFVPLRAVGGIAATAALHHGDLGTGVVVAVVVAIIRVIIRTVVAVAAVIGVQITRQCATDHGTGCHARPPSAAAPLATATMPIVAAVPGGA